MVPITMMQWDAKDSVLIVSSGTARGLPWIDGSPCVAADRGTALPLRALRYRCRPVSTYGGRAASYGLHLWLVHCVVKYPLGYAVHLTTHIYLHPRARVVGEYME